jgi:hypothetical protein
MMTHYTTGVGHNVLQLGTQFPEQVAKAGELFALPGWQKAHGVAPITVQRLDDEGGEVSVEGAACYEGVEQWTRKVTWTSERISVEDHAKLAEAKEDIVLFRWHLGTEADAMIQGENGQYSVTWPDAKMELTADAPLTVTQVKLPDNTLAGHTSGEESTNIHTCVVVQTRDPVQVLTLTTQVTNVAP